MQIEPPETIHFPIHSLQELQEQRGGLRVSALGSAALSAPSEWRVTAFQTKADTLASSSSLLALKTSKNVFSGPISAPPREPQYSPGISPIPAKRQLPLKK